MCICYHVASKTHHQTHQKRSTMNTQDYASIARILACRKIDLLQQRARAANNLMQANITGRLAELSEITTRLEIMSLSAGVNISAKINKQVSQHFGSQSGQGLIVYLAIMAVLAIIIMAIAVPVLDSFTAAYLH